MGKKIADFLRGEIVSSVFYILFGLCLLAFPGQTINVICKIVFGLVMAGAGIYHIFIYAGEKDNATILDLFTGVIVLVLGVFLFFTPQIIVKILPYLLGAFILVDSIWTLKGAWKLSKLGNAKWKVLLIGSIIFVALGIAVIVGPFGKVTETVMFAGGVMLVNGLSDLVFLFFLKKGIRRGAVDPVMDSVEEKTDEQPEKKEKKKLKDRFKKAKKEILPEHEVDEGENEDELGNEVVINGRWKSAPQEEAVSPANEMQQIIDADRAAAKEEAERAEEKEENLPENDNTLTEERQQYEGQDEEPKEESTQEKEQEKDEILEEWVD